MPDDEGVAALCTVGGPHRDQGVKWRTLVHQGPVFSEKYHLPCNGGEKSSVQETAIV